MSSQTRRLLILARENLKDQRLRLTDDPHNVVLIAGVHSMETEIERLEAETRTLSEIGEYLRRPLE